MGHSADTPGNLTIVVGRTDRSTEREPAGLYHSRALHQKHEKVGKPPRLTYAKRAISIPLPLNYQAYRKK